MGGAGGGGAGATSVGKADLEWAGRKGEGRVGIVVEVRERGLVTDEVRFGFELVKAWSDSRVGETIEGVSVDCVVAAGVDRWVLAKAEYGPATATKTKSAHT